MVPFRRGPSSLDGTGFIEDPRVVFICKSNFISVTWACQLYNCTWHGPLYKRLFPRWYKVQRLLCSMWFVSQTGSRTWSQVSCRGKHSNWLHPNLSKVVRQTCGLGMHLKNTKVHQEPGRTMGRGRQSTDKDRRSRAGEKLKTLPIPKSLWRAGESSTHSRLSGRRAHTKC